MEREETHCVATHVKEQFDFLTKKKRTPPPGTNHDCCVEGLAAEAIVNNPSRQNHFSLELFLRITNLTNATAAIFSAANDATTKCFLENRSSPLSDALSWECYPSDDIIQ